MKNILKPALLLSALLCTAQAQNCTADCGTPTNLLAQARIRTAPATATPINDIKLPTAQGDEGTRTCCPLAMAGPFDKYFKYHQVGNKNITDSYGLQFLSTFTYPGVETIPQTLTLDQQMYPFAFYAGSSGSGLVDPGYTANSILLLAEIREVFPTPGTTPSAANWTSPTPIMTSGGPHAIRAWWAGIPAPSTNPYNVWDGSGPNWFHTGYMDGYPRLAPNYLKPNHTYMMKISLVLAEQKPGDEWRIKEITCANYKNRFIWWNWGQGQGTFKIGTNDKPEIQFNEVK